MFKINARTILGSSIAALFAATATTTVATAAEPGAGSPAQGGEARLKEIVVTGQAPKEGGTEAGYRVNTTTTTGPWGRMELQDTPYSISVMPEDFIANVQANTPAEILKYVPYAHVYIQAGRFADNTNLRGFYNNLRTIDGMKIYGVGQTLEDKERVEVMTGLTGFMYGISNPAGVINYVTKRPTAKPLASVTLTTIDGVGYNLHGDFGGQLGGGLGYRLNIVGQDGGTFVEHQKIDKYLLSGALDWRLSDRVLLEFDASTYYQKAMGMQVSFSPSTGKASDLNPKDIDTSKLWGQKWSMQKDEYTQVGSRLTWNFDDTFTLRAAARYSDTSSERLNGNATNITNFQSPYSQTYYHISPSDYTNITTYAYLDSRFSTGPVSHVLTAGFSWDRSNSKASPDRTASGSIPGSFNFSNPIYVDKPNYVVGSKPKVDYVKNRFENFVIGDDIKFSESWSALVGANYTSVNQRVYNLNTGAIASNYDKGKTTPTASLLFKPVPAVTTYVSYLEALEQGGVAPDVYMGQQVVNAGEVLKPMVSKQVEIGAKATVDEVLLTAALFKIDKANQYTDPTSLRYVQDGREVHKGLELTATGRLWDRLNIVGGFTWMDAKIKKNTVNTDLEGKRPSGVPETMGKLYLEYDIAAVPGLTLTGGAFYSGSFYMDSENTDRVSGATTFDLGARYRMRVAGQGLTLRVNVSNLTDKRYWLPYGYLSDPRYVSASAQLDF